MASSIERMVSGVPTLGSCGGVLEEIQAVLRDGQTSLSLLGEIVEKDPDITARLLKLGNSCFYGFPSRMETVSDAISLIGVQQVQDLISISTVVELFEGIPEEVVTMESFWKHSLACGLAARALAVERRIPKSEPYFVAGLLHDIGRLVLYSKEPLRTRQILQLTASTPLLMRDAEMRVLGFDHADIGEAMLRMWNYPPNLLAAVRHHHTPTAANGFQFEAAIVHVADFLANAMEIGSSGEHRVPPLHPKAWDRLHLPLEVLPAVMETVDEQMADMERIFLAHR